jgi:long-chain fatty acid transport protein
VAAPIESMGAIFWNPASISALPSNEVSIGGELPLIEMHVTSGVDAGAFGPGTPPVDLFGETRATTGVFPLASLAAIYHPEFDPNLTFGLGMFAAGGLYANYRGDASNPILSPQPPNGFGSSNTFSLFSLLQVMPTAGYKVTDRLSVGFSPVVTMAILQGSPSGLSAPDDANGDGFATYPAADGTHPHYALGFQLGLYYDMDDWQFGFNYKSRGWFETFELYGHDELGFPRTLTADIDIPESYLFGVAYKGIERLLLAADIRYVDNDAVDVFGKSGFKADGSLSGLGWRSVVAVALGAAYDATEKMTLRAGFYAGESPIADGQAAFNVSAPVYYNYLYSCGFSYKFTKAITLHTAYYHAPEATVRGPFQTPTGPVAGTFVENRVSSNAILIGAQVKF